MHTHIEENKKTWIQKESKYDINRAQSAEFWNVKPHDKSIFAHSFVNTDLWIAYNIFKTCSWLLLHNPKC